MLRRSILGVALAALTACSSDPTVVSPTNFYAAYTPTVLNYAATRGGMLTEITGNPFDVPQEDLDRAITEAMRGAHFGPTIDFITVPPEDYKVPYRVVMVFDAAQGHTEAKLCRSEHGITPQTGDRVRVHAALCAKESPLTAVSGSIAEADGPDDPRFRRLIRQITTNLFPPDNPDRRDSDRRGLRGGFFLGF